MMTQNQTPIYLQYIYKTHKNQKTGLRKPSCNLESLINDSGVIMGTLEYKFGQVNDLNENIEMEQKSLKNILTRYTEWRWWKNIDR